MAYRMTTRRARALAKAQRISAQKRRKRFGFASGRKLSGGHKKVIAGAVAGVAIAGAGAGVWKFTSSRKRPLQTPPGDAEVRPSRPAKVGGIQAWFNEAGGGAAKSREISRETTMNHTVNVHVRASGSQAYKNALRELHGQRVPGGGKQARYNVIEVNDSESKAQDAHLRNILFSEASAARRERRLDRGLPDYG